jgi:hypothetical protein
MVTGDNIDTAKAIATECGILTKGGVAMEGPVFRKLTPAQLDAMLPSLQVLARSSPDDKHTLVTRLNGTALPSTQEEWEALHLDAVWARDKVRTLHTHSHIPLVSYFRLSYFLFFFVLFLFFS